VPAPIPKPVNQALLTVLSNLENDVLANIRNAFYPAPPLHFLHLSPWNDAQTLLGVVTSTVLDPPPISATVQAIKRVDIVGHALLRSNDQTHGFTMGQAQEIAFGVVDGQVVGGDCLTQLLSACDDAVQIRLILCDGNTMGAAAMQLILDLARRTCAYATLWYTSGLVQPQGFGPGGFTRDDLLTQFQPAPQQQQQQQSHSA
jgi:hypothetical protein